MMTNDEKKAWDSGFEAHDLGAALRHNPHEPGPEHDAWANGWFTARETGGIDGLDQG